MTLLFPNTTRTFDAARKTVRFVGHDGMFEIDFAVDASVLFEEPSREDLSEAGCLAAFDCLRESIHDVAREAYANNRLGSYRLTAVDFL